MLVYALGELFEVLGHLLLAFDAISIVRFA
jgi:hypothetical protein